MGSLKIKQKKKAFIPYTNKQSHMFAQSIQNCQKELKEMELKAFDDGFEDGKNWSDVLNFVILFYVMHELHGWGWKRIVNAACIVVNIINQKWDVLVLNVIVCVLCIANFIAND